MKDLCQNPPYTKEIKVELTAFFFYIFNSNAIFYKYTFINAFYLYILIVYLPYIARYTYRARKIDGDTGCLNKKVPLRIFRRGWVIFSKNGFEL